MANLLVVDDEKSMRDMLRIVLKKEGHHFHEAEDGTLGLEVFSREEIDLVLLDLRMPKMHGIKVLQSIRDSDPDVPVIVITAVENWESAVQAMRLGAFDYIRKPFDMDLIRSIIARALEERDIKAAIAQGEGEGTLFPPMEMVGNTPPMRDVFRIVKTIAPANTTVVIQGESGTGKELVARSIHYQSLRRTGPFIVVNCGAFPETLLESELFGHLRGAYTGAISDKRGLLEVANKGTFFLDEVGDLTPAMQVKLLRVLEDRQVTPVGGTTPRPIDVRFITATNKTLAEEVKEGRFREDLYYRLNVIAISLPSLRDRKEDIPLLAGHFLAKYGKEMSKPVETLDSRSMDLLLAHDWPGNVRELENVIHRAVALSEGDETVTIDVPISADDAAVREIGVIPESGMDLEEHLEEIEKEYLQRALRMTGGKMTAAAKLLGLSFRSMRYKVKKYGMGTSTK
jgi:two-component system response regulator PilR (NtrC family)